MVSIQVEHIDIELIKINAVKIIPELEKLDNKREVSTEAETEKKNSERISINFKQKEKNQNIDFYVTYTIPLTSEKKISFDAELRGTVTLSSDVDLNEIFRKDDKWFSNTVAVRILNAVDKKLKPVFDSMNLDYNMFRL